jgi:hypothetical protein
MGGDPLADRAGLPHVEDLAVALAVAAVEEVDTGGIWQGTALLRDPLCAGEVAVAAAFGHR